MTRHLYWAARIEVTDHALARTHERVDSAAARADVRGDVRSSILAGRVTAQQPNWTRGGFDELVPGRAAYVWDADATRCWVLLEEDRGLTLHVMTVLLSSDVRAELGQERRLRRGMRRA